MAAGALVGAQIGGAISHRVRGRWIVRGLAAALTLPVEVTRTVMKSLDDREALARRVLAFGASLRR